MTTVLLDSITEGERARQEYRNLDALADSIRELGVLSPVALTPDFRLVCGGRRVRAARLAGLTRIPAVIVSGMDDALLRLKAERDENVCREPMTPSEMVALGLEIERLERPKAAERMAEGGRRGADATNAERWGVGVSSGEPTPTTPGNDGSCSEDQEPSTPEPSTRKKVAEALGVSEAQYTRMKGVVQAAEGAIPVDPEAQEIAQEARAQMDSGATTVTAAYEQVRAARNSAPKEKPMDAPASNLAIPQPPKMPGTRRKHTRTIGNALLTIGGACTALDEITTLDGSLVTHAPKVGGTRVARPVILHDDLMRWLAA